MKILKPLYLLLLLNSTVLQIHVRCLRPSTHPHSPCVGAGSQNSGLSNEKLPEEVLDNTSRLAVTTIDLIANHYSNPHWVVVRKVVLEYAETTTSHLRS